MEDVKALKARAKELRDQISGYAIGKATAEQLIKEIAHHEAAMKSLAQKMARAEKKKSKEAPAPVKSVKRAPATKKSAAAVEAEAATKKTVSVVPQPEMKKPEEMARVIAPSPMRRRILGMDNADLSTHLYGSN